MIRPTWFRWYEWIFIWAIVATICGASVGGCKLTNDYHLERYKLDPGLLERETKACKCNKGS